MDAEIGSSTGPAKLLWVAGPVVIALLWLAWRLLRARWPSRHGLNLGFSLLLLAYVLTTAGLGLFWVANQQLPVFDWHYLFGYVTLVLLAVHLVFNGPVVWRALRRCASAATPPRDAGTVPGRRPWLGLAGFGALGAALGLGYLLGLRHGRTEIRLAAAAGGAAPHGAVDPSPSPAAAAAGAAPARAWAVVEAFHAFSSHSRRRVLRHAASTDWGPVPPPFKRYPAAAQRLVLAAPGSAATPALPAVPDAPDAAALGIWLWHTAGISATGGGIHFRTAPSSGALFATELYLVAWNLGGLAAGIWHYDPQAHALTRLPQRPAGESAADLRAALGPLALPAEATGLLVASAVFARSGHKYGDRTYRYVLADLGHALENLRVAARQRSAVELTMLTHFDEAAIAAAIGLDARREGVLAVAAWSARGSGPPARPEAGLAWASPALEAGAATGLPATMGLTEAVHRATSLVARPGDPAAAGATAAGSAGASFVRAGQARQVEPARAADAADATEVRLPAARPLTSDALAQIARRRSVRRFTGDAIALQALADILAAMTGPPPQLSAAVRIDLLTAAAQGLEPAAWRHHAGSGTLRRRVPHGPALRGRARAAALDQDVIGDAAVVFVLSLDRAALLADPAGPARGYRHGLIEAGLVGERIYLAAGALGLAACAVGAFYDDEAAALLGLDPAQEWPVHFAALGVPARGAGF